MPIPRYTIAREIDAAPSERESRTGAPCLGLAVVLAGLALTVGLTSPQRSREARESCVSPAGPASPQPLPSSP